MNVLTIGISPYLLTSQAKINAMVLEYLYFSGYSVAGIVKHHNIDYFLPEESNGEQFYYYKIKEHKIPIIPFVGHQDPAIEVYEIMKRLQPDVLITIGDLNDFLYMKAVKMFVEQPFKWLALMMNYTRPINENNFEVVADIDGIMCVSNSGIELVKDIFKKDEIDFAYVGAEKKYDFNIHKNHDKFRIMISGKNCQSDNIPMLMEAALDLRKDIPNLELYVHTNIHDKGDFDFLLLKERFDPKNEFIVFPNKYVSLIDGYSDYDFRVELFLSDLFVSIPMNSASGLTIFDAIACECLPLMSDVGCHREISNILGNLLPGFKASDFLVQCTDLMVKGEVYLGICNSKSLKSKINKMYYLLRGRTDKKEGYKEHLKEFVEDYRRDDFLEKITNMVESVYKTDAKLCVESV